MTMIESLFVERPVFKVKIINICLKNLVSENKAMVTCWEVRDGAAKNL